MLSRQGRSVSIHCIDTNYGGIPKRACLYAIKTGNGEAAIFDTGTPFHYQGIKKELSALGIDQNNLTRIFISHVHMDHCGNASKFVQDFSKATIFAHPESVPHLINPSTLIKHTKAVMNSSYELEYGNEVKEIPEGRVQATHDGMAVRLAPGSDVTIVHTPGHARHHIALIDPSTSTALTGDAFGARYSHIAKDKAFVATSPPTFNPDLMKDSISKILSHNVSVIGLTHFGFHEDVESHAESCFKWLDTIKEIAHSSEDVRNSVLKEFNSLYKGKLNEHWHFLRNDVSVAAKGAEVYSMKLKRKI